MSPRERRERLWLAVEGIGYLLVLMGVFGYIAALEGVQP